MLAPQTTIAIVNPHQQKLITIGMTGQGPAAVVVHATAQVAGCGCELLGCCVGGLPWADQGCGAPSLLGPLFQPEHPVPHDLRVPQHGAATEGHTGGQGVDLV